MRERERTEACTDIWDGDLPFRRISSGRISIRRILMQDMVRVRVGDKVKVRV